MMQVYTKSAVFTTTSTSQHSYQGKLQGKKITYNVVVVSCH